MEQNDNPQPQDACCSLCPYLMLRVDTSYDKPLGVAARQRGYQMHRLGKEVQILLYAIHLLLAHKTCLETSAQITQ